MSEYTITLATVENRGDHAADVQIAYEYDSDETVADLLHRIAMDKYGASRFLPDRIKDSDFIVIRRVVPKEES
jgi:hypothetical protein